MRKCLFLFKNFKVTFKYSMKSIYLISLNQLRVKCFNSKFINSPPYPELHVVLASCKARFSAGLWFTSNGSRCCGSVIRYCPICNEYKISFFKTHTFKYTFSLIIVFLFKKARKEERKTNLCNILLWWKRQWEMWCSSLTWVPCW